jgi:chemotaxis protein MotB
MKKSHILIILIFSFTACVPPGKLVEAFEANNKLSYKYDSLYKSQRDTIAIFFKTVDKLNDSIFNLNDSVRFYRHLKAKPLPVPFSKGDMLYSKIVNAGLINEVDLNYIISQNDSSNASASEWITALKKQVKTITGSETDLKLNKGVIYVDVSTKLLFNSGKNSLTPKANLTLIQIAKLLNANANLEVMIEGHTDNKPFKSGSNIDNWDLSVQRATTVVKILQTQYKINPKRIIAAGRGEYMPIDDNKTEAGRSNNRYIRLVLMPTLKQVLSN